MPELMNSETAYLALGSNLGDRLDNLRRALSMLGENLTVGPVSGVYETLPRGVTNQPPFLNLVLEVETQDTPEGLLLTVKAIEQALGRTPTLRWGPRVIDIDILLFGQMVIEEEGLQIPHPRMLERGFVILPLLEIVPNIPWVDGRRLSEHVACEELAEQGVRRVSDVDVWQYASTPDPPLFDDATSELVEFRENRDN